MDIAVRGIPETKDQEKVAVFRATIHGVLASKANSRRQVAGVTKDGKAFIRPIKSVSALSWMNAAAYQVPPRSPDRLLHGPLIASIRIWYPSERADLDESLLLDFLQGRAYANDRQVRERHVYHAIDKRAPRVSVLVTSIDDVSAHMSFMAEAHSKTM